METGGLASLEGEAACESGELLRPAASPQRPPGLPPQGKVAKGSLGHGILKGGRPPFWHLWFPVRFWALKRTPHFRPAGNAWLARICCCRGRLIAFSKLLPLTHRALPGWAGRPVYLSPPLPWRLLCGLSSLSHRWTGTALPLRAAHDHGRAEATLMCPRSQGRKEDGK